MRSIPLVFKEYADLVNSQLDFAGRWNRPNGKPSFVCENDGFQFHLTTLAKTTDGKSGVLSSPYDPYRHNTYRLGFETEDINQYNITITMAGNSLEHVVAEVFRWYNGNSEKLDSQSSMSMAGGDRSHSKA